MGRTATALVGFAGWFALLSILLGLYRLRFVVGQQKAVNSFATDGQDLDPLGHRLTRARNNCYETLPAFAALALGASIAGRLDVTDPLAMWVLRADRPVADPHRVDQCSGRPGVGHVVLHPDPDLPLVGHPSPRLRGCRNRRGSRVTLVSRPFA
jgi:hypothetical protein